MGHYADNLGSGVTLVSIGNNIWSKNSNVNESIRDQIESRTNSHEFDRKRKSSCHGKELDRTHRKNDG